MRMVILADELPQDVTGAEELLQRLSEHKTEIDAHKNNFTAFQNKGKKLIAANHYAIDEVVITCKCFELGILILVCKYESSVLSRNIRRYLSNKIKVTTSL